MRGDEGRGSQVLATPWCRTRRAFLRDNNVSANLDGAAILPVSFSRAKRVVLALRIVLLE